MWVIFVVVAYTLEQAQLGGGASARRRRRRIVALPRPPNPNLRVFLLPDGSSSARAFASIGSTTFAARAAHPTIAHIARIRKPVAGVVLLLLLELERALLHPHPVPVAAPLADVYRRVCAPAVAKGFPVFPVARGAGADGRYGGV
jgi:hypothetical protein